MDNDFFFFKQKTAYEIGTGDWSSDVCSSDLAAARRDIQRDPLQHGRIVGVAHRDIVERDIAQQDRKSVV